MSQKPLKEKSLESVSVVEETRSSLLSRLRIDHDNTWREFVGLYGKLLHGWVVSAGLQSSDADDVVQESLLRIRAGLDDFRSRGTGSFRAWIAKIAANAANDFLRIQVRNHGRGFGAEGGSDFQRRLEQVAAAISSTSMNNRDRSLAELFARIMESVRRRCDERTWLYFARKFLEQRPVDEIAKEFSVSPSTVQKGAARVMSYCREEVKVFDPDLVDRYNELVPPRQSAVSH